ncbi:hypothetical protein ACIGO8_33850 [Streptomyces sp. NPDC053493]|uniref:hypothetical protein n=1 Tax=Streptomyces sp. NPDC053493 TaxID=3365705 RepID=UPI0037D7E8EE
MSSRTIARASRWLRWGQPKCTCGNPKCQQLDYLVLGVPAWLLALGLVVTAAVAMLAYTAAQRI